MHILLTYLNCLVIGELPAPAQLRLPKAAQSDGDDSSRQSSIVPQNTRHPKTFLADLEADLDAPWEIAGIRLQKRDLNLLSELGEVSLLDTTTIHERHFPNDKTGEACRRRLRLYGRHGLTQQINLSVSTTSRDGRQPIIHRLTPKGAEILTDELGPQPLRPARSDPPKPHTLLHRLGMAKVVLAVNDSCRLHKLPKPEWLLEYDPIPGVPPTAPLSQRFVLRYDFPVADGTVHTCWPDAACLLTIPKAGKTWQLAIFWEYDRSTEPLAQVAEKMPGYEQLLATQAIRQKWPNAQAIRIFLVVSSEVRLRDLAKACQDFRSSNFIRLSTAQEIAHDRLLTEPIWRTVVGEMRSIL